MLNDYLDFEIEVQALRGKSYPLAVRSPGGDVQGSLRLPTSDPAYPDLLRRLSALDTDEDTLLQIGHLLFKALFRNQVALAYAQSRGKLGPRQGLRIRLRVPSRNSKVAELPWEFLADPDDGPLAMLDAPIVRHLLLASGATPLKTSLPLRVLLSASQVGPPADVPRELAAIRAALQPLGAYVQVDCEPHLTTARLRARLADEYHIWHFVGHGGWSGDGSTAQLLFEDASGGEDPVSAPALRTYLNRSGLRLVVLNACDSARLALDPFRSLAPALVRADIPAVIAQQFSVDVDSARAFAADFYRALARGLPIDACVTEGRKAVLDVAGLGRPDWGVPVVYTRAADGKLFDLPPAAVVPAAPPAAVVPAAPPAAVAPAALPPAPDTTFVAGPPIRHPHGFFGRGYELSRLFGLLRGSQLQNAAVIGPRRCGKSSLLRCLQYITMVPRGELRAGQRSDWLPRPERYRWIYIDFQDTRLQQPEALLRRLLDTLGVPVPVPCDMDHFLEVAPAGLQQPTVVLLDEIGAALERYSRLDNTFWEGLRSLASSNDVDGRLGFVLASHTSPVQLAHDTGRTSSFFNTFAYTTTLGPFTEPEARELIASSPQPFSTDDADWIVAQSGRWPILLQILCRERVFALEAGDQSDAWRAEGLRQIGQDAVKHLLQPST